MFANYIHNEKRTEKGHALCCHQPVVRFLKNLLESELFGYMEGAFTGAAKGGKKQGCLRQPTVEPCFWMKSGR